MTVTLEKVSLVWLVWTPNSHLANHSPAKRALGQPKRVLQLHACRGEGVYGERFGNLRVYRNFEYLWHSEYRMII